MGKIIKEDLQPFKDLQKKFTELDIQPTVEIEKFADVVQKINPAALVPVNRMSADIQATLGTLKNEIKRFHGAKMSLLWFPPWLVKSPCADKFGYLTSATVRSSSKLDFNPANQALMEQLGNLMGDGGRDSGGDSTLPSGYTYFGQFVDHDITLDVSSSLDVATDATTIHNMRTPSVELDSLYGRGPALEPYLYVFPSTGPSTAIKFKVGSNTNFGTGGPAKTKAQMVIKTDFDVPRVPGTLTAIIGDPRNDENLIVSQFHHAMLRFHNAVVDMLKAASFSGDIFVEAKRMVTHHYQWTVVNDYLRRICGDAVVTNALSSVSAPIGSAFSMPVEFAVAAYRFGHSLIRNDYFYNHNFPKNPLAQAFEFIRVPRLPVFSNWVINFNAFFKTGVTVTPAPPADPAITGFNNARKIDSVLANGLETIPGGSGIMKVLAARNLKRGLAFGLPSGQATATALGLTPMTNAQLVSGLPANELAILNSAGGVLLTKTPLWYYILREAAVLAGGNTLGPVGAKIVAETFVRMLKRDANSYLNAAGGFTPILPAAVAGKYTVPDMLVFAGVTQP